MRRAFALRALLCVAVFVASVATVCAAAAAASQAYELQRRMGTEGSWGTIASFTLSRATEQSAPRLKNISPIDKDLSKEEKTALTSAQLVFYRVIAEGKPEEPSAMVSISPCSIIRGFEAVDSTTVVLREKLRILPGPGASIIGMQTTSETNFFHSKMRHGDECDLSVVQQLFPTVRVRVEVGLLPHVELASKVNYADLRFLSAEERELRKSGAQRAQQKPKKVEIRRVRNADGEWVEQEVEVDDRTFLQKYWVYIVGMVVMSVVQNAVKK